MRGSLVASKKFFKNFFCPFVLLVLVCLLVLWIYLPGVEGPYLLDDRSNLSGIGNLGEESTYAIDYILGNHSGPLGRPVSMATFVFEELFLGEKFANGKLFNIYLHVVNGVLFSWFAFLLLCHRKIPSPAYFAVLAAAIWMTSPLFVSTVLYTVQRMAILATTFMLLAAIAYVHWRNFLANGRFSWFFLSFFLIAFPLALYSKENSLVIFPVLLLSEVLWLEGRNSDGQVCVRLRFWSTRILMAGLAVSPLLLWFIWGRFSGSYSSRDFTLVERLLTQGRVLWDYVGQIFWPDVVRMGIYHDDFSISRGLTEPNTTIFALVAWVLVLLFSLYGVRSRLIRPLSLGLFAFLVAHSIESSFIPLEIYFEHRNYFPAIFLVLGVFGFIGEFLKGRRQAAAPLLCCGGVVCLVLAAMTSSQVFIWSSTPLLRLNTINQHPYSARANEDMAFQLASAGGLDAALLYSDKAFELRPREKVGDRQLRDIALYCLAKEAVPLNILSDIGSQSPDRPFRFVSILNGLVMLIKDDRCPGLELDTFTSQMSQVLLLKPGQLVAPDSFYIVMAGLENHLQDFQSAYQYIDYALMAAPDNVRAMLMQLHFTTALGKVAEAEALKQRLLAKQAAGELSVGDQQTLALYLEPEQD